MDYMLSYMKRNSIAKEFNSIRSLFSGTLRSVHLDISKSLEVRPRRYLGEAGWVKKHRLFQQPWSYPEIRSNTIQELKDHLNKIGGIRAKSILPRGGGE